MLARINGVQVGYDDYGQGPAVVFIHDYPLNRQMWRYQVEPLVAAGFRVVLADLVEAMTRRDRAKTVAAILAARFTDAELEWLSNQLGRVPHERKRK